VTEALRIYLIREYNEQDVAHEAHLTVYFGRSIKVDNVENYGHEGGHACNGVNL